MHPGRRTLCNYGRTPARPGFAKPRDRGKGTGGAKMTTRSAERTLGLCSSNVAFSSCPSLSLLSLSTPSSSSPTPGLAPASLFFGAGKKKLTGALNLRAGGLLAGLAGRGDSDRAASYLMKFVLLAAWTKTPGAAVGGGGGHRPHPLALLCSLPARRLPSAPAPLRRLPLQPHSNMASSLCACPALFFKIIILCVCSELLQRPFPSACRTS